MARRKQLLLHAVSVLRLSELQNNTKGTKMNDATLKPDQSLNLTEGQNASRGRTGKAKMTRNGNPLLVMVFAFFFFLPPSAFAQMEDTSPASVTYAAEWQEFTEFPGGFTAMRQHLKGVIVSEDPMSPIHLNTQDCFSNHLLDSEGTFVAFTGHCVAIDGEGDSWWLSFRFSDWEVVGGSGKFAGMEGSGTTEIIGNYPDGRTVLNTTIDLQLMGNE